VARKVTVALLVLVVVLVFAAPAIAAHGGSPTQDALGGALGEHVRPDTAEAGGGLAEPGGGPGVALTAAAILAAALVGAWSAGWARRP
jgi:hypothetical protein